MGLNNNRVVPGTLFLRNVRLRSITNWYTMKPLLSTEERNHSITLLMTGGEVSPNRLSPNVLRNVIFTIYKKIHESKKNRIVTSKYLVKYPSEIGPSCTLIQISDVCRHVSSPRLIFPQDLDVCIGLSDWYTDIYSCGSRG